MCWRHRAGRAQFRRTLRASMFRRGRSGSGAVYASLKEARQSSPSPPKQIHLGTRKREREIPGTSEAFAANRGRRAWLFQASGAFALKSNAVKPADEALFCLVARIGLTKDGFDETKLSPPMREKVSFAGLPMGQRVAISSFAST